MQGTGVIPCLWAGTREVNMAVPPPGPATWGPGRAACGRGHHDNSSRPRTGGGTMGLRLGIGKEKLQSTRGQAAGDRAGDVGSEGEGECWSIAVQPPHFPPRLSRGPATSCDRRTLRARASYRGRELSRLPSPARSPALPSRTRRAASRPGSQACQRPQVLYCGIQAPGHRDLWDVEDIWTESPRRRKLKRVRPAGRGLPQEAWAPTPCPTAGQPDLKNPPTSPPLQVLLVT